MSVGRKAAAGAAIIVVLFGGALLAVDRLFAEPEGAPPARPGALQPSVPAPSPRPEPDLPPPPALPPPGAPSPAAPPSPAPRARPPVPVPQGVDLLTSLDAVRARILECGGLEPEMARPGGGARRGLDRPDPKHPRTVLMLDLEPRQGELVVRGIEVVSLGGQDGEDLVRCARQELSGRTFEATNARPGQNLKMQFVVDRARR